MKERKKLADDAMKLFQGGMPWNDVAKSLGISVAALYSIRTKYLPDTIRKKLKWTEEADAICISLGQRGASFKELYEALPAYSHGYIRDRADELGLTFIIARDRKRMTTKKELRKMLQQGDTNIQIAQKLGCASGSVTKMISQFGLRRTEEDLSLMRSRMNKERAEQRTLMEKLQEPKEGPYSIPYFEKKLQKLEDQRIKTIGTDRFNPLTREINAVRTKIACLKQTLKPSAIERDNLY